MDYIRGRKTVGLDELAAEFGMRTQEAIKRVQALEEEGVQVLLEVLVDSPAAVVDNSNQEVLVVLVATVNIGLTYPHYKVSGQMMEMDMLISNTPQYLQLQQQPLEIQQYLELKLRYLQSNRILLVYKQ